MAKLLDKLATAAEGLSGLLHCADHESEIWQVEFKRSCVTFGTLMRMANLPGSSPDKVYVLVDLQVLGKGLKAPVMMHDDDGKLLPGYANQEDAMPQAKELNMAVMELPIV